MAISFNNIKAVLFDLDGTLYIEDTLIGDIKGTLNHLRSKGVKVVYLTNNSSKTIAQYKDKLEKLGIYNDSDIIYSSLDASIDYLNDNFNGTLVYPVCTNKVKEYLVNKGINVSENADIVLLCFDRELNYEKLVKANYLIVKGAKYFATHPDITCPAKEVFEPDTGSFIKLLEASSNRLPDIIIGKPNTVMGEYLIKRLSVSPNEVLMVGDRLHTDIAFGVNNNFETALVMSGETDEKMLKASNIKPSIVLQDANCLKHLI